MAQQSQRPSPPCFPLAALCGVGEAAWQRWGTALRRACAWLARLDVSSTCPGSSFRTQVPQTLPRPETQRVRMGPGVCVLQQWYHHHSAKMVYTGFRGSQWTSRKSTQCGFSTSFCPKRDAGNRDNAQSVVSSAAAGARVLRAAAWSAGTRGGCHGGSDTAVTAAPRRLTPGSGEGQGVAGQERQPGDSLATPPAVPVHKDRFAVGRWWRWGPGGRADLSFGDGGEGLEPPSARQLLLDCSCQLTCISCLQPPSEVSGLGV